MRDQALTVEVQSDYCGTSVDTIREDTIARNDHPPPIYEENRDTDYIHLYQNPPKKPYNKGLPPNDKPH